MLCSLRGAQPQKAPSGAFINLYGKSICSALVCHVLGLKYNLCGSNEPYVFRCVAFCCALFCYIKKFEGSKDTDMKDSEFEGVNGKVNEDMDLEEEFEAEGEEKEKN